MCFRFAFRALAFAGRFPWLAFLTLRDGFAIEILSRSLKYVPTQSPGAHLAGHLRRHFPSSETPKLSIIAAHSCEEKTVPNHLSSGGNTNTDATRQQNIPIVNTCPRLRSPRWEASIMLPNPIIVVRDVRNTALAVALER